MASSSRHRWRLILHLVLCAALFITPTPTAAEEIRGPSVFSAKKGQIRSAALGFATLGLTRDAGRFDALLAKLKVTKADLQGLRALRCRGSRGGLNRLETRLLDRLASKIFQATGENIVRTGILLAQESRGKEAPRERVNGGGSLGQFLTRRPHHLELLWRGGENPSSVILTPYYPSGHAARQQDWYSTHIRQLKAERKPQQARAMVNRFKERIVGICETARPEVIVGVPSSTKQSGAAQLLAEAISQTVGVPFAAGAIQNSPLKQRRPQKQLSGLRLRLANTSKTFTIDARQVKGRRVLLVDDNLASGITAEEIRLRLYQAGAAKVVILNFGKAPMH